MGISKRSLAALSKRSDEELLELTYLRNWRNGAFATTRNIIIFAQGIFRNRRYSTLAAGTSPTASATSKAAPMNGMEASNE